MTEIRPALTERQWKEGHYLSPGQAEFYLHEASLNVGGNKWDSDSTHDSPDDLAALAAMALAALPDDDPRKITRADVRVLEQAVPAISFTGSQDHIARIAAKLAALLPPEGV